MGKNQLGLNVHIVPLGFEIERAIAPFVNRHPDKVILVVDDGNHNEPDDKNTREQQKYTDIVLKKLQKENIIVVVEKTNAFELSSLIRTYSSLIRSEKEEGNTVSINISSSGRFASVAAAFAGMAHNITVYYVKAESYTESSDDRQKYGVSRCNCNDPEVIILKNFQLKLPKDEDALILEYLYVRKNELNDPWTSPKEIGGLLHEYYPERYPWEPIKDGKPSNNLKKSDEDGTVSKEYSAYRKDQAKFLIKFQTSFARDLESENYIERKGNEKKHVYYQITPSGEYALYLYGISNRICVKNNKIIFNNKPSI